MNKNDAGMILKIMDYLAEIEKEYDAENIMNVTNGLEERLKARFPKVVVAKTYNEYGSLTTDVIVKLADKSTTKFSYIWGFLV